MPRLKGMFPFDVSRDGSELLLGHFSAGTAWGPYALWVSSVLGSGLRRLGNLEADTACWSPDGKAIGYNSGNGIFVANADGTGSHKIADVPYRPNHLSWSPDSQRFRVTVYGRANPVILEISRNSGQVQPLLPDLAKTWHESGTWTADGKFFLYSVHAAADEIWALRDGYQFWGGWRPRRIRLTSGGINANNPHASANGSRIVFLGIPGLGELVRYEPQTGGWQPYLGGIPAVEVDFSPDRHSITYIHSGDASLWRSGADGKNPVHLTTGSLRVHGPRWSPNGKTILFYGSIPSGVDSLYVLDADGGAPVQLTFGTAKERQADPVWSPDGARIAFSTDGGSGRQKLQMMDMTSKQPQDLVSGDGLWSPRWSPDGRYIAALDRTAKLWLYDMHTHARRQLTSFSVGFPSWSADGRALYFESGGMSQWFRLTLNGRKLERLADLSGIQMDPTGFGWLGLTPDRDLISTRRVTANLYSLDWDGN